ncbi:MAG: bifunctional demethylmenaquinone methyltransferase/2-methoxy-6-polyprenyl-1,4-benzoquinol methylase UbiE [Tannerellaceae bacterium]|nr:bifunctional demethylmenaquinone methyltransferase/2-methoxy-6-polyprenyl-1,4-benzoquinol methylase UbiE [Tannerellaceae bacterium]
MKYGSEKIVPYNTGEQKKVQVKRMFDSIAGAYDPLNRTLSLGIDLIWRKRGIRYLQPFAPGTILDIATGTGDLAIAMYEKLKPDHITGADISEGMMEVGRKKVEKKGLSGQITFEYQDCTSFTYPDHSFDAVTAAFGVRNFEDISQGLAEMYRVLKPGGHLMILELSTPEHFPMKQLYTLYSKTVIPYIGQLFSKEKAAYQYLPTSIQVVAQGQQMVDLLKQQGFIHARVKTFTFGICSMYTGEKNNQIHTR